MSYQDFSARLGIVNDLLCSSSLQDIHRASVQIGTFCNYTIGNVMAAQLFAEALKLYSTIKPALAAGEVHRPLRPATAVELTPRLRPD